MAQKPLLHFNLALALLLAAGMAASCADDLPGDGTTGTPITFDAPRAVETRAAVEGINLPEKSSFLVWGGYEDDYTNVFDGVTVSTTDGTNWTYDGTRYWQSEKNYNFYALYPADVKNVNCSDGTITITEFDCSATGDAAIDLMTASRTDITYEENETPQPVGFVFKHLLARVKFTIVSEGDAVTINSAKVYGVNYKGTCTWPPEIGSPWTELTDCAENNTPFAKENILLTTDALSTELFGDLLLPHHDDLSEAMLKLQYQYTGKAEIKTATLPLGGETVNGWTANTGYHYQVTIPKDAVDVTMTVTVNDWTPKDVTVEW